MSEYSNSTSCLTLPGDSFGKQERRTAVKTFSKINGSLLVYTIVASIAMIIMSVVFAIFMGEEKYTEFAAGPYYIWVMQIICMYVIAFPIFLLMVGRLPKSERQKDSISFKEFGYIFLVSEAIMLAGSIFSEWFVSTLETKAGFQVANTTSDLIMGSPIWVVILVVVVIGPIVEELIFRKVIIDRMSVYGDRAAVLMSSIAFGLFHGNFHQLFYATALGLVLGYVYTKTRRCIYTVLLHMMVNFMGSVPALLLQDSINRVNAAPSDAIVEGQLATDIMLINSYVLLEYGMAIAGIVILLVATFKRSYRFSNEYDIKVPFFQRARVYLLNFGTIAFIAFMIYTCIISLNVA